MRKKGLILSDMAPIVMTILLIGILGAVGLYILSNVNTTMSAASGYYNVTGNQTVWALANASAGTAVLLAWLPLIAVVCAAGIVIGVLISAFVMRREPL